jgi:hypothetical protein
MAVFGFTPRGLTSQRNRLSGVVASMSADKDVGPPRRVADRRGRHVVSPERWERGAGLDARNARPPSHSQFGPRIQRRLHAGT